MLKKQPGFVLKKIKDSYYLLPFGQQVADQKKGLFLNETGAFLWECLCDTKLHAKALMQFIDVLAFHNGSVEKLNLENERYYMIPLTKVEK